MKTANCIQFVIKLALSGHPHKASFWNYFYVKLQSVTLSKLYKEAIAKPSPDDETTSLRSSSSSFNLSGWFSI